jgi:hypothetical protein
MRAVVGLLLQQADEVFFGCGHEQTLAPAGAESQSGRNTAQHFWAFQSHCRIARPIVRD